MVAAIRSPTKPSIASSVPGGILLISFESIFNFSLQKTYAKTYAVVLAWRGIQVLTNPRYASAHFLNRL